MPLDAVGVYQLQHFNLLGLVLVRHRAGNTVTSALLLHRGLHFGLDLQMILVG